MTWRRALLELATNVEDHFDQLKYRLERRLHNEPIIITPYLGHGSRQVFHLCGRVLEDKGIVGAMDNDTIWENLVNMYRRLASDEIPHARVRVYFGEAQAEATANEEGFFELYFEPGALYRADQVTYEVQVELLDYPQRTQPITSGRTAAQVIVPPPEAQFGVISDLDDTVIQTNVLDIIKMARNTFLQNSRTRLPFEGVAAFYRALQVGTNNTYNPIFYVSSSPWNLYDLLVDFFVVREIPVGPFFLKDLGLTPEHFFTSGHMAHKFGSIRAIMDTHENLPFILIGDSTQEDPDIYVRVAQDYPERILAIYIRDVTENEEREREILRMADQLKVQHNIDMLLVPDTVGAAEHAVLKGFIPEAALMDIRIERTEDAKPAEPLEKLLDPNATAEDVQQASDPHVAPPKNEA